MAGGWKRLIARLRRPETAVAPPDERCVDVRPLLAAHGCGPPLEAVLDAARALPVGGRLRVVAPFDPAPMRRALLAEGFQGGPTIPRDGGFEILFTRMQAALPRAAAARVWRDEDGAHLDLRGLAAPAPMVEILRAIEADPAPDALTAWLDREPLHLYPELEARGWSWDLSGQGDSFALRLTRDRPA
jgi:uncharacterized protein (DUF2249 family)